jgi:hypothetical protein
MLIDSLPPALGERPGSLSIRGRAGKKYLHEGTFLHQTFKMRFSVSGDAYAAESCGMDELPRGLIPNGA